LEAFADLMFIFRLKFGYGNWFPFILKTDYCKHQPWNHSTGCCPFIVD